MKQSIFIIHVQCGYSRLPVWLVQHLTASLFLVFCFIIPLSPDPSTNTSIIKQINETSDERFSISRLLRFHSELCVLRYCGYQVCNIWEQNLLLCHFNSPNWIIYLSENQKIEENVSLKQQTMNNVVEVAHLELPQSFLFFVYCLVVQRINVLSAT